MLGILFHSNAAPVVPSSVGRCIPSSLLSSKGQRGPLEAVPAVPSSPVTTHSQAVPPDTPRRHPLSQPALQTASLQHWPSPRLKQTQQKQAPLGSLGRACTVVLKQSRHRRRMQDVWLDRGIGIGHCLGCACVPCGSHLAGKGVRDLCDWCMGGDGGFRQ